MRRQAYNDATGKTVTCQPGGNLSIGIGVNLETGLDDEEIRFLTSHRLGLLEAQIVKYSWYGSLDDVRKSVILDIAFNQGLGGLLHYPHMISALAASNWVLAASECTVQDPRLQGRYTALASLLANG